jgi:hypothetical protein
MTAVSTVDGYTAVKSRRDVNTGSTPGYDPCA